MARIETCEASVVRLDFKQPVKLILSRAFAIGRTPDSASPPISSAAKALFKVNPVTREVFMSSQPQQLRSSCKEIMRPFHWVNAETILLEYGSGVRMERLLTPMSKIAAFKTERKYTMALVVGKGWVYIAPTEQSKYTSLTSLLRGYPYFKRCDRGLIINSHYLKSMAFERNPRNGRDYYAVLSVNDSGEHAEQTIRVARRNATPLKLVARKALCI